MKKVLLFCLLSYLVFLISGHINRGVNVSDNPNQNVSGNRNHIESEALHSSNNSSNYDYNHDVNNTEQESNSSFNQESSNINSGNTYVPVSAPVISSDPYYSDMSSSYPSDTRCSGCSGSGNCTSCHGAGGFWAQTGGYIGEDIKSWITCGACNGTGHCGVCHGSGRI